MSDYSFHYLSMAIHSMVQKNFRSHPRPTKNTGLSQGSQRRQPERDCRRLSY